MREARTAKRTPWQCESPDVIIHSTVRRRDAHPCSPAAKSGDAESALSLVWDLLSSSALTDLGTIAALSKGERAMLLPVIADEALGFNAIPDALAQTISRFLRVPVVSGKVVQINKVGHTRAPTFQRLVTPALFDGPVEAGGRYILVDDHVGVGGTLANLRGFVETNGGQVIGMTSLTESRDGRTIALSPDTLEMLKGRHGEQLDTFWRGRFGFGIDCLTEIEAQNLARLQSLAAIEDFLAQAAIEARGRGLETAL